MRKVLRTSSMQATQISAMTDNLSEKFQCSVCIEYNHWVFNHYPNDKPLHKPSFVVAIVPRERSSHEEVRRLKVDSWVDLLDLYNRLMEEL